MNIVILDDYQDAVRKLQCAAKLEAYPPRSSPTRSRASASCRCACATPT
jgi:hypothetical protein